MKTTCFISDKTSSLIVPPPDSFHDKYDLNSYQSTGMDTGPDMSSPSPSTSTLTNTTDPLRLLCNIKHNHTINVCQMIEQLNDKLSYLSFNVILLINCFSICVSLYLLFVYSSNDMKTNNRLTYAEIILPNDNHSEYHRKNIIAVNNIGDIDYRRQSHSPHVLLSAKVERLGSLSLSRSDQTSEDEESISVVTSNTPIKSINAKNESTTVESFLIIVFN